MFIWSYFLLRNHMIVVLPLGIATFFIAMRVVMWAEAFIEARHAQNLPRWKQRKRNQQWG